MSVDPTSASPSPPDRFGPVHVAGNELSLLTSSSSQLDAYTVDIKTATQSIDLEAYIFADDPFGRRMIDLLSRKSREGVRVRVLVDAVGSLATDEALFTPLLDAGGQVHIYRPVTGIFSRWNFVSWFNRRDHRQLLVVDGRVGYFGGMNIVDTAHPDPFAPSLPHFSGGWKDVQVRVEGPFVGDLAIAFDRLWRKVVHRDEIRWPKWPAPPRPGEEAIVLFDSFPAIRFRRPDTILVPLLRAARERIVVSMAYFVPIRQLLRTLADARSRGVEVDVFVPADSDVPAVLWATRHLAAWLLARKIALHERSGRMLHSKLVRIDDELAVVGSCNLDPRSLCDNLELFAVVRSREFAELCDEILADDRSASQLVRPEDLAARPWWTRWRDWLAWRFRRML